MNLQDVGSIGELVAAIATVLTLVYLSIQVRHNSRALDRSNEFARAGSVHDITLLFNELNWRLASDGELADIYTRALAVGRTDSPTVRGSSVESGIIAERQHEGMFATLAGFSRTSSCRTGPQL